MPAARSYVRSRRLPERLHPGVGARKARRKPALRSGRPARNQRNRALRERRLRCVQGGRRTADRGRRAARRDRPPSARLRRRALRPGQARREARGLLRRAARPGRAMRIHYLSASRLPSPHANSVHVMKMCNAFAGDRHAVTLFAYRSGTEEDVYAYYGVQSHFPISRLPPVPLPGLKRLTRTFAAARNVRRLPPPDLVYGRDLYSVLTAVGTDVPIVYEAHMPPQTKADARLVEKLLQAKNFARLVVISDALAKRFTSLYPGLAAERIVVAHDA